MKTIALAVLFFFSVGLIAPYRSQANPALTIVPVALVGAVVLTVGATQYVQKKPGPSSYSHDGHSVTTGILAIHNTTQAGKAVLVGKAVTAALDLKKAYNSGLLAQYGALWQSIKDFFTPAPGATDEHPANGDTFSCSNGNFKANSEPRVTGGVYMPPVIPAGCMPGGYRWFVKRDPPSCTSTGACLYQTWTVTAIPSDDPITWPPPSGLPEDLTPQQTKELGNRITQGAAGNPQIAQDLDNLMKDHPEAWAMPDAAAAPAAPNDMTDYPPAQPITAADLKQYASQAAGEAQQAYIDKLKELLAQDPNNLALQAELAKALADQAKENAEEVEEQADDPTFPQISDSQFSEPYSPGEFDIGRRFSDFLDRIKSTGLFSFSNGFFNSLPSGGSPVIEINGGETFGHHTIDLSQTMNAGLAVLRTIFLCIFGFLSIRVVILKR